MVLGKCLDGEKFNIDDLIMERKIIIFYKHN